MDARWSRDTRLGVFLRAALYVALCFAGLVIIPGLIYPHGGLLVASALGTFLVAAIVNVLLIRMLEGLSWRELGLRGGRDSWWNLLWGWLGGLAAAGLVVAVPVAAGLARWRAESELGAGAGLFVWMSLVLGFGAAGEELLFRGYLFQILAGYLGPFATILPASLLFGMLHLANTGINPLGSINTVGWGILLSVALLRSGDLWFPIGLHFGWNWALAMLGANLSGFKMGLTGRVLEWSASPLWSGGSYGPEASWLTTLVLILLGVYLWRAPVRGQFAPLMHRLPPR